MNKIQLEIEQKKEYTAPQMEIVDMHHEVTILEASGGGEGYSGVGN